MKIRPFGGTMIRSAFCEIYPKGLLGGPQPPA